MVRSKKNANRRRRRRRSRARRRNAKAMASPKLSPSQRKYLNLVADPCHGPLARAPGGTGTSMVERSRTTFQPYDAHYNGYVLWFPSYTGLGASEGDQGVGSANLGQNFFVFTSDSLIASPTNTTSEPTGSNSRLSGGNPGQWIADPAAEILSPGSPFSRGKTLAACLQMDYIGKLSDISGQVAVVKNLSTSALSDGVKPMTFPSIEDVFRYAHLRERTSLEGTEVKWRPAEAEMKFRTTGGDATPYSDQPGTDTLFRQGSPAETDGSVSCLVDPDAADASGILIAWMGIASHDLIFNGVKVSELEIAPVSHMVESPVTSTTEPTSVDYVVGVLDSVSPGWQTSLKRTATKLGSAVMSSWVLPRARIMAHRAGANFQMVPYSY